MILHKIIKPKQQKKYVKLKGSENHVPRNKQTTEKKCIMWPVFS